MSKSILTLRD